MVAYRGAFHSLAYREFTDRGDGAGIDGGGKRSAHLNSAPARAHVLEIKPTSFFLDRGVQFCPDLRQRGQLLGGQPTKRFRDGLYEELFIGASPFIVLISD
ncbi:hypothetical protein ACVWZV_009739 [Bradyrhizobium sp. GM5.1]